MKILCLNVWEGGYLKQDLVMFIEKYVSTVDIFCFQEVEVPFRSVAPLLDDYNELHAEKKTGLERFDQSVFIRTTIVTCESGELLKDVEGVGLGNWATIVRDGGNLTICNFHGIARPGDKCDNPGRLLASQTLVNFGVHHPPCIIMGDFNLRETTESVALFEKNGFRNLIKEFKIETTRNHHIWDRFSDDKQMYTDCVFVGPEIDVKHFEVLPDIVSDHQPLLLEIQ